MLAPHAMFNNAEDQYLTRQEDRVGAGLSVERGAA